MFFSIGTTSTFKDFQWAELAPLKIFRVQQFSPESRPLKRPGCAGVLYFRKRTLLCWDVNQELED
jgi:hypothetical protein